MSNGIYERRQEQQNAIEIAVLKQRVDTHEAWMKQGFSDMRSGFREIKDIVKENHKELSEEVNILTKSYNESQGRAKLLGWFSSIFSKGNIT